jgi:hypothetical protein
MRLVSAIPAFAAVFDDGQVALDEDLADLQPADLGLVGDDAAVFVGNAQIVRPGQDRRAR